MNAGIALRGIDLATSHHRPRQRSGTAFAGSSTAMIYVASFSFAGFSVAVICPAMTSTRLYGVQS